MAPRRGAVRVIAPEESFHFVPDTALESILRRQQQQQQQAMAPLPTSRRPQSRSASRTSIPPTAVPSLPSSYPLPNHRGGNPTAETMLKAVSQVLHAFSAQQQSLPNHNSSFQNAFPTQHEWTAPSSQQRRTSQKRSRSIPLDDGSGGSDGEYDAPQQGLLLKRVVNQRGRRSQSSRMPSSSASHARTTSAPPPPSGRHRSQSLFNEEEALQSYRDASAMRVRSRSVSSHHQPRPFSAGNGWAAPTRTERLPSVTLPNNNSEGRKASTSRRSRSRGANNYLPQSSHDGSHMFASGLAAMKFDKEKLATNPSHGNGALTATTTAAAALFQPAATAGGTIAPRCHPQWSLVGTFKSSLDSVVQVQNGILQWHQRNPKGGFQLMRVAMSLVTDVSVTRVNAGVPGTSRMVAAEDDVYHVVVIKTVTKPSQVSFGFLRASDAFQWKTLLTTYQKSQQ